METNLFYQFDLGGSEVKYYANVDGTVVRITKKEYDTAEKIANTFNSMLKYIKYIGANTFEIGFND